VPSDNDIEALIKDGRHDVGRWMANGLGIYLHDKQLAVLDALYHDPATFFFLWWANRAGKTTTILPWHLHGIFYKYELPEPETPREYELWLAEDYRTIHTSPLNVLAQRAWSAISEITKGTHPAQRSEDGKRREAPLGAFFTTTTERSANGSEHLVVRCLTGGTTDFYSTEGGGSRIEGTAWWRGSWDEWPQQEAADKGTAIRDVLTRLENRLSDFDGKLLITGTVSEDTEHIARDWIERCDDPDDKDWWGMSASRMDNPSASRKAMALAERSLDDQDYKRTVLGELGGVRGRLFPGYMVEPTFTKDLPRFTPPHPEDGATFEAGTSQRGRFRTRGTSPWTYFHLWDLAIAQADNVGLVFRVPADMAFSPERPIEGVRRVVVPGSRTLTSAEIIHTIEEVYLPYGGQIVLDATDAHGKNIARELRKAGYPIEEFIFNERDSRRVIRKEAALHHAREIMTEGMVVTLDTAGEPTHDADGVPVFDRDKPYGAIRLPREWLRTRDQIAVLKVDDDKQRKDEAMAFLMGCDVAYRARRTRTRQAVPARFAVFASSRRYGRTS
jgi:hypothetical protein